MSNYLEKQILEYKDKGEQESKFHAKEILITTYLQNIHYCFRLLNGSASSVNKRKLNLKQIYSSLEDRETTYISIPVLRACIISILRDSKIYNDEIEKLERFEDHQLSCFREWTPPDSYIAEDMSHLVKDTVKYIKEQDDPVGSVFFDFLVVDEVIKKINSTMITIREEKEEWTTLPNDNAPLKVIRLEQTSGTIINIATIMKSEIDLSKSVEIISILNYLRNTFKSTNRDTICLQFSEGIHPEFKDKVNSAAISQFNAVWMLYLRPLMMKLIKQLDNINYTTNGTEFLLPEDYNLILEMKVDLQNSVVMKQYNPKRVSLMIIQVINSYCEVELENLYCRFQLRNGDLFTFRNPNIKASSSIKPEPEFSYIISVEEKKHTIND